MTRRRYLLVLGLLVAGVQSEVNDIDCPSEKHWIKNGKFCDRLESKPEPWRIADANCRLSKGKSMRMRNNSVPVDEWLAANRKHSQESSHYWTGAHVPALTLASYFDRCLTGFHRHDVCYQIVTSPMTWQDASSYCSDSGGHIVRIDDEATSRFVETVTHDVLQHVPGAVTSNRPAYRGYWIDGRSSEDLTMEFVDRLGRTLNYTNLQPSIVFDSSLLSDRACLEVLYEPQQSTPGSPGQSFGSQANNRDEDEEDLPQEPEFTENVEDPTKEAPLYKIQHCEEKRIFVCEYSLLETIRDKSDFEEARELHEKLKSKSEDDEDAPSDYSHLYSPSRVRNCREIVILSELAKEMKSNMETLDEHLKIEIPFLDMFVKVTNGYYIMSKGDAVNGVVNFTLDYCDIKATRDSLNLNATTPRETQLYFYLHMFSWSKFDFVDDSDYELVYEDPDGEESDQSFTDFHRFNIDRNFTFFGPCVYFNATGEQDYWYTSPCARSLPYICEYPPNAATELATEDAKSPMAQIERKIEEFDIVFGGSMTSLGPQGVEAALDVLDKIVGAGEETNGTAAALSTATFTELETLLENTLPIVDALQSEDADATAVNSVNINGQYQSIRAVNTLAEQLADKFMEEQGKEEVYSAVKQLNYKTNTSEVRIVLAQPQADYNDIVEAATFQPENVEKGTQITLAPTLDVLTGNETSAFVFAVHSSTAKHHQEAAVKMAPSFVTTSNGRTHVKLVKLDEEASWRIATPIVTATLRINGKSIPTPVQFYLPKFEFSDVLTINRSETCSYIVYNEQEAIWSDSGCYESQSQEEGVYQCACNHTTDFAVLLLVYTPSDDLSVDHEASIFILTVIGESFSILSLITTALTYFILRSFLKSDRIKVHLHLVVGLLITYSTLLVSQIRKKTLEDDVTGDDAMCTTMALLLHFGLLVSFGWMLVEGFILYKKILIVLTRETPVFERKYYVIGWLMPFLIVFLSFVICTATERPYNDTRCWLAVENGVVWSFAGPALIILLVNFVILGRVLSVAVATKHRKLGRKFVTNEKPHFHEMWLRDFKVATRGVAVLTPLLGVTWIFGFLSQSNVVFAYAFIFCNSFQGFYLFLFYVVFNPEVRSAWEDKKRLRERNFLNNVDLPKLPTMDQTNWFRRFSTSLLTRLSPTTPDSSGNTSPNFENPQGGEFNGVMDFIGSTLPSRPSSGHSISKRIAPLAVSLTSLRPKSGRVCPEVTVVMTHDSSKGADWESADQSESVCHESADDVFCDAVTQKVGKGGCGCLHHLSSGSCGSNGAGGDLLESESGDGDPNPSDSIEKNMNEMSLGEAPKGAEEVKRQQVTLDEDKVENKKNTEKKCAHSGRRQLVNHKCGRNDLMCQSRLCTICNKNPRKLRLNSEKPQKSGKPKAKVISSKRPATAGNCSKPTRRRGPKARKPRRRTPNLRLVPEAWSTKAHSTSLEVLAPNGLPYAVDDMIGHLEFESAKVSANGRPQSSESHDSGIVITN